MISNQIGEYFILNEYAKTAFPTNVGESVKLLRVRDDGHYHLDVEMENGDIVPVFNKELTKPKKEDLQRMTHIKRNNKVIYTPTEEIVKIVKTDYLNGVVEIEFEKGMQVVGMETIKSLDGNEPVKNRRVSWDEYFMDIAQTVSSRATCDRLHVGCVIVKDKRIVSTGYNGSVTGQQHCDEIGHYYNEQGRCVRTIHAEQNAILYSNREELQGSTAYVTHQPCENCAKLLVQSGVSRIVYKHKYDNMFSDFFLGMIKFDHLGGE